jgi:replicative DNA helicase
MMLYRDDYYNDLSETPGVVNVLIRKNRNWPTGQVDLKFEKSQQKFYEVEKSMDQREYVEEY